MSEVTSISEVDQKSEALKASLESLNIEFPPTPIESYSKDIRGPREWLLRGQSQLSVLTDSALNYTVPWNSGELTRGGVFFADNYKPLVNASAIIVARASEVHNPEVSWLMRDSKEFGEQVKQAADELGLDITSIGGYHNAALEVQRRFDTYEVKTGITTLHEPFPLDKATYLLLSKGALNDSQLGQIPQNLRKKIFWKT